MSPIQYLLLEKCSDCNIVTELGLPRIMMHLASRDDYAEVREAALRCLLVLTRYEEGGNNGQLVKNDDILKQVLQERIEGISSMAPEDLGAAREARQLVDLLWIACYNEPSSLQKKGLLVLPGEDPPALVGGSNSQLELVLLRKLPIETLRKRIHPGNGIVLKVNCL